MLWNKIINIFPFLMIITSHIDDFSRMRSHDTINLISSDAKDIVYVCVKYHDI